MQNKPRHIKLKMRQIKMKFWQLIERDVTNFSQNFIVMTMILKSISTQSEKFEVSSRVNKKNMSIKAITTFLYTMLTFPLFCSEIE